MRSDDIPEVYGSPRESLGSQPVGHLWKDGRVTPDEILAALDEQQREVALAQGPVVVYAGAGSGKTRAITHRIAYRALAGTLRPEQTLALTFTARAAGEMRSRLRTLGVEGVQARTFHAAALRQLTYFWPKHTRTELPRLSPSKARHLSVALRRNGLRDAPAVLQDVASEIEWAKVNQVSHDDYILRAKDRTVRSDLGADVIQQLYADYDEIKTNDGAMDFEDVLLLAKALLEEAPALLNELRAQYRSFVVDEYQDISAIQQQLLDIWIGDGDDICAVGDINQTIYSFAGADPKFFMDFPKKFPQALLLRLSTNYRSTPEIVHLANQINKRSGSALELHAVRPKGSAVQYQECADEEEEASGVADRIKVLTASGVALDQIAVLYRTNAQSAALESSLARAGIPFAVRNGEGFFHHPKVREALRLLRAANRSAGEGEVPDRVREVLEVLGWRHETPPDALGAGRDEWEMLNALYRMSGSFDDFDALIQELEDRSQHSHAPLRDAVTLASLHSVKGMEWAHVFLVGANEGLIPISLAKEPAQIEEERRLFYVGITRAKESLTISWGNRSRQSSRFLREIGIGGEIKSASSASLALCKSCGKPLKNGVERKRARCGECPLDVNEELFEALRAWRYDRAKIADVPAFVIFTDATLEAIAALRPKNNQELLTISGIGARKLEDYGVEVLAIVALNGVS